MLLVTTPARWSACPFLPVSRTARGAPEHGVMLDARGLAGLAGYPATVFAGRLFALPPPLPEFLGLPREVFDHGEEVIRAGRRVDRQHPDRRR